MSARPARYTCLCPACLQDFGSESAFDYHRAGSHDYTHAEGLRMDPPREDGRRCLDVDEMKAKGMHKDSRGRWRRDGRDSNPLITGVPREPELWSTQRGAAA